MATKQPKVGDLFYNEAIYMQGVVSKIYVSPWIGEKVLDVEYADSKYEDEVYRLDKVEYREGTDEFDACFVCAKGYFGE